MTVTDLASALPPSFDQAFAGNRLLSTFPGELRGSFGDGLSMVQLEAGDTVLTRGVDVDSSLFPFGATMISMIIDLDQARSVEVASIGREGAVGGIVSCGHLPAFSRAEVIVGGMAVRIPMKAIEARAVRMS